MVKHTTPYMGYTYHFPDTTKVLPRQEQSGGFEKRCDPCYRDTTPGQGRGLAKVLKCFQGATLGRGRGVGYVY